MIYTLEAPAWRKPDAACRPRPREPPVTTTTFPLREKMEGKSWSSVSGLDILGRVYGTTRYDKVRRCTAGGGVSVAN